MAPGPADRLRETTLMDRWVGGCRLHSRTPDATTLVVDLRSDDLRAALVLVVAPDSPLDASDSNRGPPDADPLRRARTLAVDADAGAFYGVVDADGLSVFRVDESASASPPDSADSTAPTAICRNARPGALEGVVALLAWRVDTAARSLYARHDALRRAAEPLVRAQLDARLTDEAYASRLREWLRAVGPVDDEVTLDPTARESLTAQASCLLVDAVREAAARREWTADDLRAAASPVEDAPESPAPVDPAPPTPSWRALLAAVSASVDDPLFDPGETPLAAAAFCDADEPFDDATLATALDHATAVAHELGTAPGVVEGSLLTRLYERLLPADRQWRFGQVYTPEAVARLLATWAVRDPTDVVLDPACGTGRFLRAAATRLADCDGTSDDSRPGARSDGLPSIARTPVDGSQLRGGDVFRLPLALAARALRSTVDGPRLEAGDFFTQSPPFAAGEAGDTNPTGSEAGDANTTGGETGDANTTGGEAGDTNTTGGAVEDASDTSGSVDAILLNPPYTRREALSDAYLSVVREAVAGGETVDRRAGLAPYFIRHASGFLEDGGRLAVVVASSWLDTDSGAGLQRFLLDRFRIHAVVGSPRHHLVDTADVNAVLLLLERAAEPAVRDGTTVTFGRLAAPVDELERSAGFDALLETLSAPASDPSETTDSPETRKTREATGTTPPDPVGVVRHRQGALRERAEADTSRGRRWGRYVRAPAVYWDLLDRRGDRLVDFHDLAAAGRGGLAYGTRSGAPDFFYLPNAHHAVDVSDATLLVRDADSGEVRFRLPRRYWMHRAAGDDADGTAAVGGDADGTAAAGDDGEWRPNYLLKRSTGLDRLRFDVSSLDLGPQVRYVLRLSEPRSQLAPDARAYVEWGETHDVDDCPHCRRAKPFPAYCPGERWYDITDRLTRGSVLPNKDVYATHAYWTPTAPVWVHQSLYGIDVPDPNLLAALLNSTLGLLMLEVAGRVTLGEGALDLMTADHRGVRFPDPDRVDAGTRDRLVERFDALASRPVGTTFEELGGRSRSAVSAETVRADRRALDRVVVGELLDLDEATQAAIYRGLVGLVDDRLTKAERGRS